MTFRSRQMAKLKFVLSPGIVDASVSETKPDLSIIEHVEFLLIWINRLLIGFVTIYVTWTCARATEIPWHAIFCTIGFVCLMSEGLVAHYRGNAWTRLCYRAEKTRMHWIMQSLALLLGLVGICIKFALEPKHFYSLHGQLGLATCVLLLVSALTGLCALYAGNLYEHVPPRLNKILHNILGLFTYALAMASGYTGFETNVFLEYSAAARDYMDFRILLQTATLLILLLSTLGPFCALMYRKIWK